MTGLLNRILQKIAADMYYWPGETYQATGRFTGLITNGSKSLQITVPTCKLLDRISSITVKQVHGGIRYPDGGYIDNVSDTSDWTGRSGITSSARKYGESILLFIDKNATYKQNGTSTAVTNNTIVLLGGYVELEFS